MKEHPHNLELLDSFAVAWHKKKFYSLRSKVLFKFAWHGLVTLGLELFKHNGKLKVRHVIIQGEKVRSLRNKTAEAYHCCKKSTKASFMLEEKALNGGIKQKI